MVEDRITSIGENHSGFPEEAVDEVVWTGITHFEMLDWHAAYMSLWRDGDAVDDMQMLRFRARMVTRAEKRAVQREDEATALKLLGRLVPWQSRTIWIIPWWRRPAALFRDWLSYKMPRPALEVWRDE